MKSLNEAASKPSIRYPIVCACAYSIVFFLHAHLRNGELMNIYTGNLSYNTTDHDLRAAFEAFGTVTSASVISDRATGQSKGFGFVEMSSNAEADAAIKALNGRDLNGRSIKVNQAEPRKEGGAGASRPSRY
jgi:RNA recognition motif-containing protein